MALDKRNSITGKATGLNSSLFDVTLSLDVSFCQSQQLQCIHNVVTFVLLKAPLLPISFLHYCVGDDLQYVMASV